MPVLFASFINGRFLVGTTKARPCLDRPDETIDGFPEFEVAAENIKDPIARQKLRALAKRIVASHNTPNRIIGFEVHGHADVDLRVPAGPQRTQTELDVSRDRGANARELLLQLIKEEGGAPIIAGVDQNSSSLGVGSQCRKVIPARTDAEMKKNRRVEIFLREFRNTPVVPKPDPKPDPKPPETGTHWSIQVQSGSITAGSSPVGELLGFARTSLDVVIVDLDRKQKAKFLATASGLTISGNVLPSALPAGTTIAKITQGPVQIFSTRQGTTLASFDGALTMGQNPTVGASVLSAGGKFVMFFDALAAVTNPKPVEVEGGNDPFTVPGFSLGISPGSGSLKMQGVSSPAP
jgi:hypothetical protein